MSTLNSIVRRRLQVFGGLEVLDELARVRQRAVARLGGGIDPRSVRKMIAKLDSGPGAPPDPQPSQPCEVVGR